MAAGKVARRTVVADVAALLDSPEIAELIGDIDGSGDPRGRKGYGARALLGACLVKSLFALPTWTFVAALIAEHPGMQDALGGCPSVWAMYRFSDQAAEEPSRTLRVHRRVRRFASCAASGFWPGRSD